MSRAIYPSQLLQVIDSAFPGAKVQQSDHTKRCDITFFQTGALSAVVRLADQIAPELLPSDQERYVEFQVAIAVANNFIQSAASVLAAGSHGASFILDRTEGIGLLSPVTYMRRALEGLADQATSDTTPGLEFLSDDALALELRLDITTAMSALRNGQWKAAAVMAGSVAEALLLWALQHHDQEAVDAVGKHGKALEERDLSHYIEAAKQLHCIEAGTATEALRVKEYRNLIHHGRAERLKKRCELGDAHIAVGALDNIIRDLRSGKNHAHPSAGPTLN